MSASDSSHQDPPGENESRANDGNAGEATVREGAGTNPSGNISNKPPLLTPVLGAPQDYSESSGEDSEQLSAFESESHNEKEMNQSIILDSDLRMTPPSSFGSGNELHGPKPPNTHKSINLRGMSPNKPLKPNRDNSQTNQTTISLPTFGDVVGRERSQSYKAKKPIPPPNAPKSVTDATWERWKSKATPEEYVLDDLTVEDDSKIFTFTFVAPLGRGVSGSVYAIEVLSNNKDPSYDGCLFAIKIFKKDPLSQSQGHNECTIMPYIQRVLGTTRSSPFPNLISTIQIRGHIAFIMELCGPTLFQIIGLRNYTGLPLGIIRTILTKILEALSSMESRGIVHADVKPENILLSLRRFMPINNFAEYTAILNQIANSFKRDEYDQPGFLDIILIDWSSSSMGYNQNAPYLQSRFYRAPEVLLRGKYGPSTDIWSAGCVIAEMFLGSPLFPGGDELDMLRQIQLKLGLLPASLIKQMGDSSPAKHNDSWKIDPSMYSPGNFEIFLRERSARDDFDFLAFINILRLMLQLNPDARITATSAMLHPFITGSIALQPRRVINRRDSMVEESASSTGGGKKRVRRFSKNGRHEDVSSSEVL